MRGQPINNQSGGGTMGECVDVRGENDGQTRGRWEGVDSIDMLEDRGEEGADPVMSPQD